MTFTVAIVGRPNVGKSTLFNRLTGKKHALVDDMPGVTRDRREGAAHIGDLEFTVIDTAGLEDASPETLQGRMRAQTEAAIAHADVVLMVVDGRAGITPTDRVFAGQLRRHKGPVVLLVNKCEGRAPQSTLAEAYSLGLGNPLPLSAEHGEGLGELYTALAPHAKEIVEPDIIDDEFDDTDDENLLPEGLEEDEPEPEALQIVIVGRPNAGKSTLVNALIGEERVLTGPEAGITRDAIAIEWEWKGRKVRLIDTAGIRKRANVTGKVEKLAVSDALRAVQYAHVVILLVDAEAPLEKQDATIAAHVIEEGRALVVAVNKWDLVTDGKAVMKEIQHRLENVLPQVRGVPVVTLSALHRKELSSPIRAAFKAYDYWNIRITTAKLNDWLRQAIQHHPLPVHGLQRLRVRYMTQVKTRPPTFALFTSRPEMLPESYIRYLINGIRERFDLPGVPVRILLRKTKNPYGEEGTRGGSEDVDKRKKKVHPAKKAALKKDKKDKKNEKHGVVRGGKKKTGKPRVNAHKKGKR